MNIEHEMVLHTRALRMGVFVYDDRFSNIKLHEMETETLNETEEASS